MEGGAKYHLRIISIFLILVLLLGTFPASNAQVTTAAQAKRVMFRDDDVTPMSLDALKAVNQVHIDEGVPVTLGVIPARSFPAQAPLFYQKGYRVELNRSIVDKGGLINSSFNSSFAEYLRSLAPSKLFELAQHGYQHRNNSELFGLSVPSEVRGMSYDEQYTLIEGGRSLMQSAFGAAPTSFIPPFNTGDENTLKALSKLGFTVYSSYADEFGPTSGGNLTLRPERLAISKNETFESLVNQTKTLLNDPSINDIVVVYHNWNFQANRPADGVNATNVEVLRQYIQYLKTNNVEFTTLSGMHPSPQVTASPSNEASTSTLVALPQKAGAQWVWAILAFAAPLLVAALLFGVSKRVK
jgi:peptidoglycan/xylan/chitin deacetylase (PgdA/CDA1 family)